MYFNGNESKKVSLVQHVFIKRDGMYQVQVSADVVEGDYLVHVNEDGSLTDELIESITLVDGVATVYRLNTEPQDWFVADGILLHNLKI
jgi:intein/homing endonuclease